jgi:hypothetical protein
MYTPEQRQLVIMQYLGGHQGSTKSDIARGLRGIVSKKTIDKLVNEMVENKIIEEKKEKKNARNIKLYLKEDNLLVSVTLQLDEFVNAFESLFFYIIENIKNIQTNKFPDRSDKELSAMDDANFYSLLQCINILDRVSNAYTAYAVIVWPKRMQDEEDFRTLFSLVFNKLASLRFYVSNTLGKTFSEKYSEIGNLPILRETYATDLLQLSVKRFNNANLQIESEPLISSIWNIHKGIAWWAFPEPRLYNWKFSIDEGHKRFLQLCKQNPEQRRDNLTPEEFERIHNKSSHKMTSNTTSRDSD